MTKKLCMGNEAIALGAINSGVSVVAGYPGTPSTEIIETVIRENNPNISVQWSTNEKVAMEVAAGASYAGARTLVTMKQVGLNVASDPLMTLAYIGVKGGFVMTVADDPGPWSSQTEQDTRGFAKNANLPVFDPASPEEAYDMVQEAYKLSEQFALPVFVRPTTRVCHASATVEVEDAAARPEISGFEKRPDWCIMPRLSFKKHGELEQKQQQIAAVFSDSRFNAITGSGKKGIAVSGVSYLYAREIIDRYNLDVTVFKVGTPYPFPDKKAEQFLAHVCEVLVIEELDPVVEEALLIVSSGRVPVFGKRTGHTSYNGEFSCETVRRAIFSFLGIEEPQEKQAEPLPPLPARPPVLCAGCPHRASFYAAKTAYKDEAKTIYCGDIGCYTLGAAAPLNATDTCLCMGAGITVAQGLKLAESGVKTVAFVGDSTFFASGITGVINAVYQGLDLTLIVLDNRTTAMTGHQPHPGTGITAMGQATQALDIADILRACKVGFVKEVNPFDFKETVAAIKEAKDYPGVAAVITKAPCIFNAPKPQKTHRVNDACIGCLKCIKEIGCPAMAPDANGRVVINENVCTGCGLCAGLCPVNAIKEAARR